MDYLPIPYPTMLYGSTGIPMLAITPADVVTLAQAAYAATPPMSDPQIAIMASDLAAAAITVDPSTGWTIVDLPTS